MFAGIKQRISKVWLPHKTADTASEQAYDLWASAYDAQPDNLMLALDEQIFGTLLNRVNLKDKTVADYGCGTGRHWPNITARNPASLTGYDVSEGMLSELKRKYPDAKTVKLDGTDTPAINDASVDVLISTLTVAHIADMDAMIATWVKALKPTASVIITDFHPIALAMGGKRTFSHQNRQVSILNYVHEVAAIVQKFAAFGFALAHLEEKIVDDTVKHYYERQNAIKVYEKFKGCPIIYGMYLVRNDAVA